MAFLNKRGGGSASPPGGSSAASTLCPHCHKDINKPPVKSQFEDTDENALTSHYLTTLKNEAADKLTQWERDFVESISERIESKLTLSPKQANTLRTIFEKWC